MATTKSSILLPYLEDTGLDGKKLYTPKEWTERLRHYIKRIHDIDIKPALSGETKPTSTEWAAKEPEIRQDFIWGAGPSAIETITKGVFNTDPDTINTERLIQLFKDYYIAETKYLPQPRRFLLGKTRRKRNTRRTLAKTSVLRKKL